MALLGVAVDQHQTGSAGKSARAGTWRHGSTALGQPRTEMPAHQSHHVVVVDIAGHRHHHPLRDVAPNVEGLQLISRHRRHRVDTADHRPAQWVVAEHRRQEHFAQGVLGVVIAHGDLFKHNITLNRDIACGTDPVEDDIGHQIDRQFKVLVEHMGVVAGVFLGGERVQLTTDGIDRLGDLHRTASGCGLEEQVLQEVRGSGNSGALIARTDVDPDTDRGRTNRRNELGDHP